MRVQPTDLADSFSKLEQVSYVSYSTGDRNISLQVLATDLPNLHYLVNEVIGKMPGVRRTTVTIIPVILKEIDQWRIPNSVIRR